MMWANRLVVGFTDYLDLLVDSVYGPFTFSVLQGQLVKGFNRFTGFFK